MIWRVLWQHRRWPWNKARRTPTSTYLLLTLPDGLAARFRPRRDHVRPSLRPERGRRRVGNDGNRWNLSSRFRIAIGPRRLRLALVGTARRRREAVAVEIRAGALEARHGWHDPPLLRLPYGPGFHPAGASSKPSNSNPGDTMHDMSAQPSLACAACQ